MLTASALISPLQQSRHQLLPATLVPELRCQQLRFELTTLSSTLATSAAVLPGGLLVLAVVSTDSEGVSADGEAVSAEGEAVVAKAVALQAHGETVCAKAGGLALDQKRLILNTETDGPRG